MKRYLLDTQAAVWLLTNNKELPDSLREEIEYIQSLISSDSKFPWYAEHCGLELLEI